MYDVLDVMWVCDNLKDDYYIRCVVMLFEVLLMNYKWVVVKDFVINVICYGVKFMIFGLLRYEVGIEVGDECVLMIMKGEVIVIGIVEMIIVVMVICDYGSVVKVKRVVMERDIYLRRWGLGFNV